MALIVYTVFILSVTVLMAWIAIVKLYNQILSNEIDIDFIHKQIAKLTDNMSKLDDRNNNLLNLFNCLDEIVEKNEIKIKYGECDVCKLTYVHEVDKDIPPCSRLLCPYFSNKKD